MKGGLRLTGGRARGRVLRQPVGEGVRPTSSRVREALFSMVGQDLDGLRVLDAFGGAGLLGLEAWSRGAEVVVTELRPATARDLRRRGEEIGADWTVHTGDCLALAPQHGPFDGVLADPPYAASPGPILEVLGPLARAWLVYEADSTATPPPTAGPLALDRVRSFGGTALWVYRRGDEDAEPA